MVNPSPLESNMTSNATFFQTENEQSTSLLNQILAFRLDNPADDIDVLEKELDEADVPLDAIRLIQNQV